MHGTTRDLHPRYVALSAALALALALTACKARNSAGPDTTAIMVTDSGAVAGSTGTNQMVMANTAMTDANIAALVDEVNMGDSTLAAAALPNLSSAGAKDLARLMMSEHHAIHLQGLQVEKAQNITPQLPANDPFKSAVDSEQSALGSMSKGAPYDSTYLDHEVAIHQAVLDWAGKITPQNAAYKKYLGDAGPEYTKHLDRAKALLTKMGHT